MKAFFFFLVILGVHAQRDPNVPPCNTAGGSSCGTDLCSNTKCPNFPTAVCAQRGCNGDCDPEFFIDGLKIPNEMCSGGCKGGKFTQWFNRDRPSGDGDYETLLHLRNQFPEKICDHPSLVDARVISTDLPHTMTGQVTHTSLTGGFWCNNKDNKGSCLDYKVRFCCSDTPRCPEGAWTNYFNRDKPSATCDCETLANLRAEYKGQICNKPTAIDARVVDTGLPYQSAGQVIAYADTVKGFRCDNSKTQQCVDYEVRFCCPEVPKPKCEKNGWTPWLNADSPSVGAGDIEDLAILQGTYQELICAKPTAVDARVRFTHESYLTVNQDLDVSPAHGLICLHGLNQRCYDYEVRFCCPDHTIPEPECKNGKWTDYYNIDTPDDKGDFETLGAIRELAPEAVCSNPTNVDVRVALTGASYLTAAQQVVIDPTSGFYCENAAQSGEFCQDYKIRFCCPRDCETPQCADGYWTRFFDVDDPDDEGDIELIAKINQATGGEVCSMPTAIDARLLNGDHYATMNQVVHVSVADGFACYNSDDQTCCDYKVRFCCPKDEPICHGQWTPFSDLDDPAGPNGGDFEGTPAQRLCPFQASNIDVRLVSNGVPAHTTGEVLHYHLWSGFKCVDADQPDGACLDYEARLCCNEEPVLPLPMHWCTAWGDPHYTTLDGLAYDFQGECLYDFLSTNKPHWDMKLPEFSVRTENRGCGPGVSCIRKVYILFSEQTIEIGPSTVVRINGFGVTLPYYSDPFYNYHILLDSAGNVQFFSGFLEVVFDGRHKLVAGVDENYRKHVHGLCGNFNGDTTDEFLMRYSDIVANNVNEFGKSHAIDLECPDPVPLMPCAPNDLALALRTCRQLVWHDCFHACMDVLQNPGPDTIIEACAFDICHMKNELDGMKAAISVMRSRCRQEGHRPMCEDPFQDILSAVACRNKPHSTYARCLDPACMPTCLNPNPLVLCSIECEGGCLCEPGYVLDEETNACVESSHCVCQYPPGTVILSADCLQTCHCPRGIQAVCEDFACNGTCLFGHCLDISIPVLTPLHP